MWFGVILGAAMLAAAPAAAQFLSDSTSFLTAVKDHDGNKVQELLDKNANGLIGARNPQGETVLHILVKRRDLQWLTFMLAKGAPIDQKDDQGMTALADAAQIGWADGATQLLQVGAQVDLTNNRGETPLILATQARDLDTVRALVTYGANPKIQDHVAGMSAYDYAKRDGRSAQLITVMDQARPVVKKAVAGPSM